MLLDETKRAQYLHRSYAAVDGLWFVKVQEQFGFDKALEIDEQVWKVLAKIQARKMKDLAGLADGVEGLFDGFMEKLRIDGFDFHVEKDSDGRGFTVTINKCPWLEILQNSNREELGAAIGDRVCVAEYGTWAKEFGDKINFELKRQQCKGDDFCVLRFQQ